MRLCTYLRRTAQPVACRHPLPQTHPSHRPQPFSHLRLILIVLIGMVFLIVVGRGRGRRQSSVLFVRFRRCIPEGTNCSHTATASSSSIAR